MTKSEFDDPRTPHEIQLYDLFLAVGLNRTHAILGYYKRVIQKAFPGINLDHAPKRVRNQVRDKNHTLVNHLIYILGDQTLTFARICELLSENGWIPERKSSVSNTLSFRQDLFEHPSQRMHSLTKKAICKRTTLKLK